MSSVLKSYFFIVLGPSGSGKSTILNMFKKEFANFYYPKSYTTRQQRKDDENNNNYIFIPEIQFNTHIKNKDFLEWAYVHKKYLYGTLKTDIMNALNKNISVIKEMDIQGLKQTYNNQNLKNKIKTIFFYPDSISQIEARIKKRSKISEEEIARRLYTAKKELQFARKCDYILKTPENKINQIYNNFKNYILKEIQI